MKRFIAFAICAFLVVCAVTAVTIVASAEEMPPEAVEPEAPIVEEPTVTETIVAYVKANIEEIMVVVFMTIFSIYEARKRSLLNGSIGTLNNNAISVAENSALAIANMLTKVDDLSKEVTGYRVVIDELLEAFRAKADENEQLKGALEKVEHFLETSKLANVELADEVAELLVLANIPNSVKDKLFARHLAAVNAIADAEHTEVIHHDGEEA